jgi:hypothetical protein|tara:strand:- start:539 stop:715 length:177 start_codon:yes stop_codon:yes gene_type:complete
MPNVSTLPVSVHPRDLAHIRRAVAAMEQRMLKMERYIDKEKEKDFSRVLGRPGRRKEK